MEAKKLIYQLSPGASASYHLKEGDFGLIPSRLSIGNFSKRPTNATNCIGEIKGTYKKLESGKFKGLNKGDVVHSAIFKTQTPGIYGYSIFDERHRIYDLLVLTKTEDKFIIYYFEGKARPEYKSQVLNYVSNLEKQNPPGLEG